MAATEPVDIATLAKYPRMTPWFNPLLLARLLLKVIVSDLFGQYADRRLILGALDNVDKGVPVDGDHLAKRARKFMPGEPNQEMWTFTPDETGSVWLDFVADLGDGFDATYTVASLLGQDILNIEGNALPRGQLLVMGGDEVYPTASRDAYRQKLRDPYDWAFPDPHPHLLRGPPVYALPGNHDWYDGLVQFLALFSRQEHLHLGGWRSHQRRSYFALQLTATWWIWAIDAQLDDDIDQPQKDYFVEIAKRMPANSNLILCGPEPGWLYTQQVGNKSLAIIDYAAWIAVQHCKGVKIPLVLSGDTHHYSRYKGDDNLTQFVTSGGGGAFLHPTHQLTDTVDLNRDKDGFSWLGGLVKKLTLATSASTGKKSCYPSEAESRFMLLGNFAFPFYNPGFALILGMLFWVLSWIPHFLPLDAWVVVSAILIVGFYGYTRQQQGGGQKVFWVSVANGVAQATLLILLTHLFTSTTAGIVSAAEHPRTALALFAAGMIIIGGMLSAELFGVYLFFSSLCLNMNHNDAFSSMRRDSHRHFLRIRIQGECVTLYPIGIDRVPGRKQWRRNTDHVGSPPPAYVPAKALEPHFIETPFAVSVMR